MPTYEELIAMGAQPVAATSLPSTGMQLQQGFTPDAQIMAGNMPSQGMPGQMPGQPPLPPISQPSGLEAAGRGALQGATFGFADELTGAIEALLSNKTYEQARDESRANYAAAEQAHPMLSLAGNLAGSVATSLVPGLGIAKGASIGKTALNVAGQGALAAAGANEDTSQLGADVAKGAALGGVLGAAGAKFSSLLRHSPEAALENRLAAVVEGEGVKGRATRTASMKIDRDAMNVDKALTTKFRPEGMDKEITLDSIMRKPAAEVQPVVEQRMHQVGKELDPLYEKFNTAEKGVSVQNFVEHVDAELSRLGSEAFNENYTEAFSKARDSILKAYAPDMMKKLAANAKGKELGLADDIFHGLEDVHIPFQEFRKAVTRLQTRASNVINPLNPGEATQLKADLAKNFKQYLNDYLEIAAENNPSLKPDFDRIMNINKEYNGLADIHTAVEQRGWKEKTGGTSTKGHLAKAIGAMAGTGLGGAIGGPIGHLVGAGAGAAIGETAQAAATKLKGAVLSKTAALEQLTNAAENNPHAKQLLDLVRQSPAIATKVFAQMGAE